MKTGIVILAEIQGALRERILDVQRRFDPRLAAGVPPHVTITGSSGMGPISTATTVAQLRAALEPIARETSPMSLHFRKPHRFMQTDIVVLPLDPNGPIRTLHERIRSSGLAYEQPRFTFTPHVTLTFFRQLSPNDARTLLALRFDEPVLVDRISAHKTVNIVNSKKLLELPLTGAP